MKAVAGVLVLAVAVGCSGEKPAAIPLSVRYDQHLVAEGNPPSGATPTNPYAGQAKSGVEGEKLCGSMNCDGCHGGGATGWGGPSLSDGRWIYGGSDPAVFQSIYYGRPHGMPAFGGALQPEIIWKLVSYIRSLPLPKSVPTQAW